MKRPAPTEKLQEGRQALTKITKVLRVCRWLGYVAVFLLMAEEAPPWAWGLLLAIILKRTNVVSIR